MDRLAGSKRVLLLGIGGGGDAVAAAGIATTLRALGLETVIGGVAWERWVVDPYPGPRPRAQISGGEPCGEHAVLVGAEGATTPEGVHFCESRLAAHLGERTVLIDVTDGAPGAAEGIAAAAAELECDLVLLVDVGGDAIADGSEPGLASPLCDAVMIAAGVGVTSVPCVLAVVGAACDGELEPAEVLARVAALAAAESWLDTAGVPPEAASAMEAAGEAAVTEASLLVARAARGEIGDVEIRGGRRTVELGPVAALCFLFDLHRAIDSLPLAHAVREAGSIEAARDALLAIGVRTELDYEENRASA